MNYIQIKSKHIIPAFIITTFGSVIVFGLLRWLLCIQFSVIDINEEICELWIPILFPWVPILIWLRPRFRILAFKDNDKGRFYPQLISFLTMAAMLGVSQSYVTTATGKLEILNSVDEIFTKAPVRYYKINDFKVTPQYYGAYLSSNVSGKHNENLNFSVYFTVPIVSDSSKPITTTPKCWYGISFFDQMSNKASNEEKNKNYNAFYEESLSKLKRYNYNSLNHFERAPTSDKQSSFLKAIESRIKNAAHESFIILTPIEEPYENRNRNKLPWVFGSFAIGLAIIFITIVFTGLDTKELRALKKGEKPEQDDLIDALNYLVPKGEHFATSIILDLNILVFLALLFSGINIMSPSAADLLAWGADRRYETTHGQWWRLFTSMFLHAGIMHLALNIAGLVVAAIFVEPILGRTKYFILYMLSGLCGSLASIWWYPNTISVGASGAIFGLFGGILGLLLTNAFHRDEKKGMFLFIGVYVLINLLWGLTGGVDNAAHMGGLLSGAVIAFVLFHIKVKN